MFKGIRKARIQEGFPKLAIANREINNYFPTTQRQWPTARHQTKMNELIVLVAPYNDYYRENAYHYIPFQLLVEGELPINRALTWGSKIYHLPNILDRYIEIIT